MYTLKPFIMKILRNLAAVVALFSFAVVASAQSYTDLSQAHENYDAIMFLSDRGVVQGYPDGSFKPEQPVNRVEAIKMIFGAVPVEDPEVIFYGDFFDIDQEAWYGEYFRKAFSLGIVEGYQDGYFRPAQTVNLVENLKILFESAGETLPTNVNTDPYADAMTGQWYTSYVQLAKNMNLLDADSQNNIYPAQGMSRGTLAETIYRYLIVTENDMESFDPEEVPEKKNEQTSNGYILTVNIDDSAYGPSNLLFPQGSTVRFSNNDDIDHTVTDDGGAFDSGIIAPGEEFLYTFDDLGVYDYSCTLHPAMTGKITVKPANEVPTI